MNAAAARMGKRTLRPYHFSRLETSLHWLTSVFPILQSRIKPSNSVHRDLRADIFPLLYNPP